MASPPQPDFSFTAPFPALKQRRVSLALPSSSPRVPWSFRDDTGIAGPSNTAQQTSDNQSAADSAKEQKKVKMRKTDILDASAPLPEKKPRKKWSPEETQMLVEGCNRVRTIPRAHTPAPDDRRVARRRELENNPQRPYPQIR